MANYDFRSLSPHDFELLCRDLLQEILGVGLESFTTGRDSGIDFRYRRPGVNLILQCKHFADSGYGALRRVLRNKERQKLDALAPTRYILATSVGLTPARKDEVVEILAPYCLGPSDIVGPDDINNLLTQHGHVERKHFKLWLTSATVLERVLHAGIFADSGAHLERIRLRLSRFVPNPSVDRGHALLENAHFCIVAGIPGIGKTTLAEVLLVDLVDRQAFTAFRVTQDLAELRPHKNPKSKQVFYFDDFLGKTALAQLQKNEDQRLVELMEEVSQNPNWRFILTTREYILNIARQRYEAFAHPRVDFQMCVINLSDYTRSVRAKILYNHIYFSDLPKEYKLALLEEHGYEHILNHRNYSPRVVEHMTQSRHACTVPPTLYLREFLDSLDSPARIWEHAYRYQISEAARHLLLVLVTLPYDTKLELLEQAFWKFYEYRHARFGFPTNPSDWLDALRELDGNFIKTTQIGKDIAVSFHNPSIRDFMEQFLADSDREAVDLLRGAAFYEQYSSLWSGVNDRPYPGIEQAGKEFLGAVGTNLWAPSARMIRSVRGDETIGMTPWAPSNERRVEFFIRVADDVAGRPATDVSPLLQSMSSLWRKASADREDLVILLDKLRERGLTTDDPVFTAARQCLMAPQETIEDFRAAVKFCDTYPDIVSDADRDAMKRQFEGFAQDYASEWDTDSDPDWLREIAGDIESLGARVGVDAERYTQDLYEKATEIENARAEQDPPDDYEGQWKRADTVVDDVHGMFGGLESDLRET